MDGDKASLAETANMSSKPQQVDSGENAKITEIIGRDPDAEAPTVETEVTTTNTVVAENAAALDTSNIAGTAEIIETKHNSENQAAPLNVDTVGRVPDSEKNVATVKEADGIEIDIEASAESELQITAGIVGLEIDDDIVKSGVIPEVSDDRAKSNITEVEAEVEPKLMKADNRVINDAEVDSSGINEAEVPAPESRAVTNVASVPENETSAELELIDYNDESMSEGVSRNASENAFSDSASDSMDDDFRDARRNTPPQHVEVISVDSRSDNEGNGNDDQEEAQDAEATDAERKESPQPPRKVDDDEDKNNPQYIPKRGTFYEHDYRTTEDVAGEEKADADSEKPDDGKKKMWHEKREKWSHDKFKDDDQAPKSRDELIAIYGYDIRNEDGPPRARRRRRYGRGPNKYTRNWEDEDAYYKTSAKKPPMGQQAKAPEQLQQVEQSPPVIRESPRPGSRYIRDQPVDREPASVQDDKYVRGGSTRMQSAGTGRIVRPNRDYASSDYQSFTKARNYNRGDQHVQQQPYQQPQQQQQQQQQQQRFRNEPGTNGGGDGPRHTPPAAGRYHGQSHDNRESNVGQLDVGMASLSLQQPPPYDIDSSQQRKPASKRYSSIRQRAFPDAKPITLTEAFAAHHKLNAELEQRERMAVYYEQQQGPAAAAPVSVLGLPPMPEQRRFVAGVAAGPAQFLPPSIALNYQLPPQHYYQHQAGPPPPPQFVPQPMAALQPQPVPAEQLFQPQGGITYYSPEEQQTTQRHAPPMRPKAAIPILPPPPPSSLYTTTDSSS